MRKAGSLLTALLFGGCAAAVSVPLPPNVHIVPPPPAVPQHLAAFSGKWVGTWVTSGQSGDRVQRRDHILVVEEIKGISAMVVFALGVGSSGGVSPDPRPAWIRIGGRFVDGELKLSFPATGGTVTYRMLPDGTLDATNQYRGDMWRADMIRAKD